MLVNICRGVVSTEFPVLQKKDGIVLQIGKCSGLTVSCHMIDLFLLTSKPERLWQQLMINMIYFFN